MKWFLAGAVCLISTCAYAQTPVQPSAQVRALSNRVLSELNDNLACSTANNELKDKLTVAETEVKRLTEKYEPKKDENKEPAK